MYFIPRLFRADKGPIEGELSYVGRVTLFPQTDISYGGEKRGGVSENCIGVIRWSDTENETHMENVTKYHLSPAWQKDIQLRIDTVLVWEGVYQKLIFYCSGMMDNANTCTIEPF